MPVPFLAICVFSFHFVRFQTSTIFIKKPAVVQEEGQFCGLKQLVYLNERF